MNSALIENIRIALSSIKGQLLRTVLTILIIAIGIMALVGILTAIDSIKNSINNNFANMGANTFSIRNREMKIRIGNGGRKARHFKEIEFDEATRFTREFTFPATASVSTIASRASTLKFGSEKTNPNILVVGGDENYLLAASYEINIGRNFTKQESESGAPVVILGKDNVTSLFKKNEDPLDKQISIGSGKYRVIGVLKEKGSSMAMGGDKVSIIPLGNARKYFSNPSMSFVVSVINNRGQNMETTIGEATGLMRKIRKVKLGEDSNFEISKSDSLANMLIDKMSIINLIATVIGVITLVGAAIGLMNIMLVSVTERTREIGIRKAIGATRKGIRNQFLIEAIVICQLGGFGGIVLGIIMGNLISFFVGGGFIVPWLWMLMGVAICLFVGLFSGLYPAIKASKLDPIEALRFE